VIYGDADAKIAAAIGAVDSVAPTEAASAPVWHALWPR
jgi:hypothetical protein